LRPTGASFCRYGGRLCAGTRRRGKDQSLTIQQTFVRQKFDQKRRAHEHAQKPSARGAEASAINSLLTKQYLALLGAGRIFAQDGGFCRRSYLIDVQFVCSPFVAARF